MADVNKAIDYILHWEDPQLSGVVTEDQGGKTRFGISQRANPDLTDENFYTLDPGQGIAAARTIYEKRYADPIQVDKIDNQEIANKVLDMFVNMGRHGIKLAQRAGGVKEDGGVGHETLTAWNSQSPDGLLTRMGNMSLAYYATLEGTQEDHVSWARRGRTLGNLSKTINNLTAD